jgi:uncharacterized protein involved in exopolysaccharide biosynthesis
MAAPPLHDPSGRNPAARVDGEVSLVEMGQWLRRHLLGIVIGSAAGLSIALALAAISPRVYRSQVLVAPNSETLQGGGLGELAGQFGGIAALAGIQLPSGGNKDEAIELLKSRGFAARFISSEELLPRLFERKWDEPNNRWRVAESDVPTLNEGVDRFIKRVRRVQEDRGTGMVTVTIDWVDREEAARWAGAMIVAVNEEVRSRAVDEAERTLEILNTQSAENHVLPVREAMYKLVENQMKTIVIAQVRDEYAFRVIDPPVAADADDYVSPNWALSGLLGAFLGAVFGSAGSIAVHRRRTRRREVGDT